MRRRVQLWRFHDKNGGLVAPIRTGNLHRFLIAREDAHDDLAYADAYGYETQLVPMRGMEAQVVLYRIRDDELPSERRAGRIVDLDPSVNELAEGSYFLFLPRNMVAFMGTGFSPRPGRLADWIRHRIGWDVFLEPVLRQDVGSVLDRLRKTTSVEIKIAADEVRALDLSGFFEGEDDPLGALLTAQRAQQGGIISVGWSVGHSGNADQGWFRQVVGRLRRADLSRFRSAKAKVYIEDADNAVPVDFLQDRVVAEIEVDQPTGRQRLLPENVALNVLREAWRQFKETDKVLDRVDKSDGSPLRLPAGLIDG